MHAAKKEKFIYTKVFGHGFMNVNPYRFCTQPFRPEDFRNWLRNLILPALGKTLTPQGVELIQIRGVRTVSERALLSGINFGQSPLDLRVLPECAENSQMILRQIAAR